MIEGILVLFIHIRRLASNEIFSPSNKIHREVGRAKGLSAPLYFLLRVRSRAFLENGVFKFFSHFELFRFIYDESLIYGAMK